MSDNATHYDVVVIGGGLAGQTLSRHLLLDTDKTVLLLERRDELPSNRQKVGESSVQLAGFYYAKVLDLEEYLMLNQFMKYNLRFYWKSPARTNDGFEDYSASFIRPFSNIASYQLNRNTFEGEVMRRNLEDPRFRQLTSVKKLDVELAADGSQDPHRLRFNTGEETHHVTARWVVDTSGRGKVLAKRLELERRNPIDHGSFFWWVDGLVDIDKLTEQSRQERLTNPNRAHVGHLPFWLATNHFCEEGLWFWVIPLQGKTSLGLVYDNKVINHKDVFSVEKATKWVCEHFPLFARDLPHREVLDFAGYKSYSYDCAQTISNNRWAMAGEAGRFTDPLYSPGSDLISIYNTLIVDAIRTDDAEELTQKCALYEQLMRAVYQAYVPTYATTYDCLGDQEAFCLKYTWELTVYFAGYVFPFINFLFTDRRFILTFMRLFSQLGPINQGVQKMLSGYFHWKKEHLQPPPEPTFFDFMELAPLRVAEKTFYRVGVSVDEAKKVLSLQVENLKELARFIAAHLSSVVIGEPRALTNRSFVEGIALDNLTFDPVAMRERYDACAHDQEIYSWSFDPFVMERFHPRPGGTGQPEESETVGEMVR